MNEFHFNREHEATLALLALLVLGNRDIEQGKFRPASDVFSEMDGDDLCQPL
jgi:hypothetical protein